MKNTNKIIAFLLGLLALTACHKDKEFDVKDAVVSNEEMTVSGTQARFSWSVDFAGKFHTGVEVSQNENMTEARRVEATKEEDKFVAIIDSLSMGKKYYYRIVVWNKFGDFGQPVGDFTTSISYTILVSADEGGSVTGGGTYIAGDTCTVVAIANPNYNFVNWTENGTQISTETEYPFAVTGDRNLVAHFTAQEFTITAIAEPEEGGIVDGSGGYNNGDECTLTANANEGYTFVNWTKDGTEVSTNPVYTFTMTETATYVAHFQIQSYTITVSANSAEGGSVEGDGTYEYGQSCTVHGTEANGYHFVNWTENGEQVSSDEEYTFTVTRDRDLVANFTSQAYLIQVQIEPEEGGTVMGAGGYDYGQECMLKATANEGYDFVNWTDENGLLISTESTYHFPVSVSATYVAHFHAINYQISVSAEPEVGGTVTGGGNSFHYGDECILTAIPNDGYEFANWTKEDGTEVSTESVYTFNVTETSAYIAHFQLINYTINVSAVPSDGGTVTGGGNGFHYEDECTLTATANTGYEFVKWTKEDGTEVFTNPYTFNMTGSVSFVAHFQLINYTISISAEPSEGGTVTGGGNGFHYGDECVVTATAIAEIGYYFINWTENGEVVSDSSYYSFFVTGNRTLVANFGLTYVDLGLPSGLLWATCNVGADNPEDYGYYFAWGETTKKSTYHWSTYQYCMGSSNTLTKYCNNASYGYSGFIDNLTTLLSEDDAATTNWGGYWRIPTHEEWQELYNNTTVIWTTQNGVNGKLFTASNGNSLFLPATGCWDASGTSHQGSIGYYWSSSLNTDYPFLAWYFSFDSGGCDMGSYGRYRGQSVRPVREN